MKVILLNPVFMHGAAQVPVQGLSGKHYGISRFYHEYGCHGVELTLEQYNAAWRDLWDCARLPGRCWMPKFVEDAPQKKVETPKATEQAKEAAPSEPTEPVATGTPEAAHGSMKYFELVKIAKAEGVELTNCKTNHERAAAINAAREQRNAVPA